jgi:hypothetical protein
MDKISISKITETDFEVTVESRSTTIHNVSLPEAYYQQLTNEKVTPETLIEKSFEFLMKRESNTSILSQFELSVIGRYFPEYELRIGEYF